MAHRVLVGAAETTPDQRTVGVYLAGAIVVAMAMALRLRGLGAHEFWLDEAFSFDAIASPDWLAVVRATEPPLYPLLLRAWSLVAGTSEAALRFPSAVLGTAFVVAVMWAGRELFDDRVALWCGVVAATSPIHIYYSQEARSYALLTLLLVCTYVLLERALRTNGWGRWALVAVAMAAGPYTHYLAPLALAPTVALVVFAGKPGRVRRYVIAVGAATLLYLPWFVWCFVVAEHPVARPEWIGPLWERTAAGWLIPKSLHVLYLGSHRGFLPIHLKQFDSLEVPPSMRVLGLVVLLLLGAWVSWICCGSGERRVRLRVGALWVLLLAPLVLLLAISWWRPLYVVGRYDQLALPAFVLLAGVGLAKLGSLQGLRSAVSAAAGIAFLVPIGGVLTRYYAAPPSTGDASRRTAAVLDARVGGGDVVLFDLPRGFPVMYQLVQLRYRVGGGSCERPASGERFACWHHPRRIGPVVTQEEVQQATDRPDLVGDQIDGVYLPALAGPDRSVFVLLEAVGGEPGRLTVSEADRVLLQGLRDRGYEAVAMDPYLGIVQLRRLRPQDRAAGG
jgi:mannosyltransferase